MDKKALQRELRDQVLEVERENSRAREQQQLIDSVSCALAETTTLDANQIRAISEDQQDAARQPRAGFLSGLWLAFFSARQLRIAVYVILGFIGFSLFRAAQVDTIQTELYYKGLARQPAIEFQIAIQRTKGLLAADYLEYHQAFNRLPDALDKLPSLDSVMYFASAHVADIQILQDGVIRMALKEKYGFGRWLELKPGAVSRRNVEFSCSSNAESHLLYSNSQFWCEYSAG